MKTENEKAELELPKKLTNQIISFIPFNERSAVFQSSKNLQEASFDDFWSTKVSFNDYLNFITSLTYNTRGSKQNDQNFKEVFKAGNVNEIKLLCRYGRFKFMTESYPYTINV